MYSYGRFWSCLLVSKEVMPHADPEMRRIYARAYEKKKRAIDPMPFRLACRRWYQKNLDKEVERRKIKYARLKSNPEAYATYLRSTREQRKERYASDPIFRIYCNARSKIICALRRGKNQKRGNTEALLGCSIEKLKTHLESQFVDGMTWENKSEWHIDHNRSCASFDLSDPAQVAECFHYSNLSPKWGLDNRRKWAHFDGYHHSVAANRVRNAAGQFV